MRQLTDLEALTSLRMESVISKTGRELLENMQVKGLDS